MTNATARRDAYNEYCDKMIAKYAQYAPARITDWKEMQEIRAQVFPREHKDRPARLKTAINCMSHGNLFDNCGVYQIADGRIVEYVEYTENRGGLSTIKIFVYPSLDAHDKYQAPLPEWIWHNH
jgi:hypothetical protein